MPGAPETEKRALRRRLLEARATQGDAERAEAAALLAERMLELADAVGATRIAAYLSTTAEPSTRPFLAAAHAAGRRLLLPDSRADGSLDWIAYRGPAEATDAAGMPVPVGPSLGPGAPTGAELLLVPALAVDRRGVRLGRGRGYIDRLLASLPRHRAERPPVYAVVFDHEVVDRVPSEPHDEPVDGAVTPTRTITFPSD